MKENENKEPSSTAGAAKGGNTSKESVGSPVSTAVGEPVATDDLVLSALQGMLEQLDGSGFSQSLTRRGNSEVWVFSEDAQKRIDAAQSAIAARLAAPTQVSAPQAVPEVLLNAKTVYDELYKTSS